MAGIKAHPRDSDLLRDVRILRGRGLPMAEVARRLGMSRATLYRILGETRP